MRPMLVVGEDALCCALGERLVSVCLPEWQLAQAPIDTRGVTKLVSALPRYLEQARYVQPVLCIADTDGRCAMELLKRWLPYPDTRLLVRLAVTEAESWLLADRDGFAQKLEVPLNKIPQAPDDESDPKRLILNLVRRSKKRLLREEMVSSIDPSKPGSGYNLHLCRFVREHWRARNAAQRSPSLARALLRLEDLDASYG